MTNPALQVLLHSAPFLLGMLEQDPKQLPPLTDLNKLKAREATNELCNLLAQMVGVSSAPQVRRSISTLSCQGALDARFNGGKSHEDAEEFLSFLLNTILESATPGWSPAESMRGSSDQTLVCPHCTQVSTIRSTPFFTWQIPLPSQEADSHSHKLSYLLLDSCTLPETLDEDNMCFCSTCNEQRAYCKSDTISSLPYILCVHLKRFTLNAGTGQTAKLMNNSDPMTGCRAIRPGPSPGIRVPTCQCYGSQKGPQCKLGPSNGCSPARGSGGPSAPSRHALAS